MFDDLCVIQKTFPHEQNALHVYAIGDVHVGSPQFNETAIRKKIQIIQDDPIGVVCLCGDLGDFALKNSKSNIYQAKLSVAEQIEMIYELFLPITDKVTALVPGNHEERLVREVGVCPMYDLAVRWGIKDVYRENLAITKYAFGNIRGKRQQNIFIGLTMHGTTKGKNHRFNYCVDNADFSISGHVHSPSYNALGRISVDKIHATAKQVAFKEIVVDANLVPGGYGLRHQYEVAPPPELQMLELTTYSEPNNQTRTLHRVMNYKTIQII